MRISPSAARYAYVDRRGAATVTVVDRATGDVTPLGAGQDPRWRGDDEVWFRPQDDTALRRARRADGWRVESREGLVSGNSLAVGGDRVAVHRTDPRRVIEIDRQHPGLTWPVYSDDGAILAALRPDAPHDRMQSLEVVGGADRRTLAGAFIEGTQGVDFRMAGTTICYRDAVHVYGIVDLRHPALTSDILARPGEGVTHACPVYLAGRGLYVLHIRDNGRNGGTICLGTWASMKAGQPVGWIVGESAGGGYEHDARPVNGSTILVAWIRPDGDADAQLVNLTKTMEPLPMRPAHPDPFAVTPTRPLALGYFYDHGKYGAFEPARNCTVTAANLWETDANNDGVTELPANVEALLAASIDAAGRAFVTASDLGYRAVRDRWTRILGLWVHEPGSVADAQHQVAQARAWMDHYQLARRPVILVLRDDLSAIPARVAAYNGVADALAPEIYFRTPASSYEAQRAAAHARLDAFEAVTSGPLYPIVQCYDRRPTLSDAWQAHPECLEALQQAGNEWVRRPRVAGVWWFAYARPGGVLAYPRLEQWHAAQVAVTPTPPTDQEPQMPDMPFPGQAEFEDLMVFLHEVCYQGELFRAGGLFESPSPQTDRIFDARRPRGEVVMDQAAFRWLGEYVHAWAANLSTPGGPHEAAKAHIRRQIHDSHEARTKRGEPVDQPPTGTLNGPLSVAGRDITKP